MNAQELRIGNWVQIEGVPKKVIAVYSAHIRYSGIGKGIHPIAHVAPIPLTPEILEMAGFERNESPMDTWSGGDHMIHEHDNGEFTFMPFCAYCPIRIEYVHQLQNVIFSLTGTELNIQL